MDDHLHDEFDHAGCTVKIYRDVDFCETPRDWDNLGTIWIPNRNRHLSGDKHAGREFSFDIDDVYDAVELKAAMEYESPGILTLPVFAYIHSGITIWTLPGPEHSPFDPGGWDSGMVGVIYVTRERMLAEMARVVRPGYHRKDGTYVNPKLAKPKIVSKKLREQATEQLVGEIKTLDDYLTGNVYGYVVEDPHGETVDSCWGFYGDPHEDDYVIQEAKSAAEAWLERQHARNADPGLVAFA
jgi:hypothetical protein